MTLEDVEIATLAAVIAEVGKDTFPARLMAFINTVAPVDITLVVGFSVECAPIELFRHFDARSEQQYLRLYTSGAYLLDPFYRISVDGTAPGLYSLRDVAPDRFFQSEYYFSYYRKLPLVDEICLTHRVSSNWCFTYSMGRTPDSGLYSAREKRRLMDMKPVLRALMLGHWERVLVAAERKGRLRDLDEMTARIRAHSRTFVPKGISPREAEIAALILQGHSGPSIAANLGIAPGTVKVLRKRLYGKLGISSQNELYQALFPSVIDLSEV